MKLKKVLCLVMAISVIFGCIGIVAASDAPGAAAVERATGSFKTTVKPGVIAGGSRMTHEFASFLKELY